MKYLILILIVSFSYSESDLLRSKYLTQNMIDDIEELDKYNRKARFIFNKYEKAKFYQIIAFTYHLKYQDLVEELNSLERQYFSIITSYNPEFDFSIVDEIASPKMKNTFNPILFSENSNIKIRLFKAKAGLFEKQYHEYLNYFNKKINLLKNLLYNAKKDPLVMKNKIPNKKDYDSYSDFVLNVESSDKIAVNINTVISNNLIKEINWYEDSSYCKRDFFYSDELELYKTIDYKDNLRDMETIYDVNDYFIDYITDNKFIRNIKKKGNYSISFFNKFDKIYKTVYYSANGEIIGGVHFDFKENLELLNESWYIGDNRKVIKEIRKIYDPKTHKYITIEDRLIRE